MIVSVNLNFSKFVRRCLQSQYLRDEKFEET